VKVLQVTPSFVPSRLGGVWLFYNLSRSLVERGHEVTVYTTDIDIGHSRLSNTHGIKSVCGVMVRYFRNASNMLAAKDHLLLPLEMVLPAKREIGSFDIIHLHNLRTFQNMVVHQYAKKYGIPYIVQAHGDLPRIGKRTLKQVYDNLWGYRILRDAAKVIALTPTEAEQYKTMGVSESKIEIIPNGIDLAEFENLPQKGTFRGKYDITYDQKIILYLGRIHQIKGLELLVKAFANLCRESDGAELVIAGPDDGYLASLKKLIADWGINDRILLTGPLYGRDKLEAYIDADVYVLPSSYEIFGTTVLEALACGTPVICSEACGLAEVIDGQVGLVVPYDEGQLSNAIMRMLSDGKMRQEFAQQGKSLVREQFSWSKIIVQIESIYESCV